MDLCQNHHHHSRRAPIELSYMTILLFTAAFVLASTGGTPAGSILYNNNRTNNEKFDINYDVVTGAPQASSSRRAQRDSLRSLALASGRAQNNSNENRKRNFGTIIRTASAAALVAAEPSQIPGRSCDFEQSCDWKWEGGKKSGVGFQVTTAGEIQQKLEADSTGKIAGPITDAGNGTKGKFLFLAFDRRVNQSAVYHVTSPWFLQTEDTCYLEVRVQLYNMENGTIKLLLTHQNHTVYEPLKQLTHRKNSWDKIRQRIGRMRQPIQVALEITPSHKIPSYVAIDDIRLLECFQDGPTATNKSCSVHEFRCGSNLCISRGKVCDFFQDCPSGEDEKQDCGLMPANTTCSFETGWCAWHDLSENSSIRWERRNKPSGSPLTGPAHDHTYGNSSGHYLYVYMNQKNSHFYDKATLQSPLFPPPPAYHHNPSSPYYNACQLRFAYHMFGPHMGALEVRVFERNPRQRLRGIQIFRMYGDQGNHWNRATANIPKVRHLYYIEFMASRGRGAKGDIAIDDISLSPECVGMGVARSELKGYVYAAQLRKHLDESANMTTLPNLKNITKYEFTTCNSSGRFGPNPEQCSQAYNGTAVEPFIKVLTDVSTNSSLGIQMWTVPKTQHYTIIAKGASGGRGAESSQMTSRGSIVKVVLYLRRGETLKILVGQEGTSVCDQNFTLPEKIRMACGSNVVGNNSTSSSSGGSNRSVKGRNNAFVDLIQMNSLLGGGGGGGGGTFVWKMKGSEAVPVVIAGGGGGLAYNSSAKILPYGRGFNSTLEPQSGSTQPNGAGGGGGWRGPIVRFNLEGLTAMSKRLGTQKDRFRDSGDENATVWISAGESVLDGGGVGGVPCVDSIKWGAQGGFGGGGGGCTAGGGGGGYVGGNAHPGLSANGEGGLSYVTKGGLYPSLEVGGHDGSGSVIIIPSLEGACTCEHHCVLLDDFNFHTACVCAENFILTGDGSTCVSREASIPKDYLVGLIICCLLLLCFISMLCIYIYNRYQKQKTAQFRRKMLGGPELQLSRIRAQAGPNGVLTEYNPNYEFSSVSSRDLKKIPRENLQLVRSIGQGAFGEVYQGFYKQRANDSVEMPVAVKTLPLLASQQAEEDFLMEAMIMSKFNHANIVHFIGVCDDKHPRFIVLELLAGGDLKTFLRESRPKPDKPSPLTMKDLLMCAMDVAKGCQYLEENHFIHRDIAARNCLLTTKGPGRVVKIADFGMARDIYRADYYKKGGKAMMPVKWMPPEAFLDGIFTSKTDVWSFGVLLWEVFSMGYMPYPGRGNQDVMHLVTHGGRLEPPQNCPTPVYGIMNQCWHPIPEERPKFATLLERLGYCIQDPEVVNAPLPVFQRPPSSERDATLMRPNPDESSCLCITQGPRSSHSVSMFSGHMPRNSPTADYLIPLSPNSSTSSPAKLAYPSIDISVPESASSETLLDDEDGVGTTVTESGNPSRGTATKTTTTTATRQQPSLNGMDHEIALNPALLDDVKRPGPYINVGMSRSDRSDEQIHC